MTSTRSQRQGRVQDVCNMLEGEDFLFGQRKLQKQQDWRRCTEGSGQLNSDEFSLLNGIA